VLRGKAAHHYLFDFYSVNKFSWVMRYSLKIWINTYVYLRDGFPSSVKD